MCLTRGDSRGHWRSACGERASPFAGAGVHVATQVHGHIAGGATVCSRSVPTAHLHRRLPSLIVSTQGGRGARRRRRPRGRRRSRPSTAPCPMSPVRIQTGPTAKSFCWYTTPPPRTFGRHDAPASSRQERRLCDLLPEEGMDAVDDRSDAPAPACRAPRRRALPWRAGDAATGAGHEGRALRPLPTHLRDAARRVRGAPGQWLRVSLSARPSAALHQPGGGGGASGTGASDVSSRGAGTAARARPAGGAADGGGGDRREGRSIVLQLRDINEHTNALLPRIGTAHRRELTQMHMRTTQLIIGRLLDGICPLCRFHATETGAVLGHLREAHPKVADPPQPR